MNRSPEVEEALARRCQDWASETLANEVERLEKRENELINALDMGQINCDAVYDELREEREDEKQRAEAAEALAERLKGHLLAHDAERTLYLRRLLWLHDCSAGTTDADGYEWGIYRVKWVNGQVAEFWQTNSDFSDLDAAMERDGYKLPASAKALEARVKELEAELQSIGKALVPTGLTAHWQDVEGLAMFFQYTLKLFPGARIFNDVEEQVKAMREQNARLRAALEPTLCRAYTIGVQRGHESTVDGRFTPVHWVDEATYFAEDVKELMEDSLPELKAALNGEEPAT